MREVLLWCTANLQCVSVELQEVVFQQPAREPTLLLRHLALAFENGTLFQHDTSRASLRSPCSHVWGCAGVPQEPLPGCRQSQC